ARACFRGDGDEQLPGARRTACRSGEGAGQGTERRAGEAGGHELDEQGRAHSLLSIARAAPALRRRRGPISSWITRACGRGPSHGRSRSGAKGTRKEPIPVSAHYGVDLALGKAATGEPVPQLAEITIVAEPGRLLREDRLAERII